MRRLIVRPSCDGVRVSAFFLNAELWDHPDVKEFFNLEALDQGKSYAERAHAAAAGAADGVGHGLRWGKRPAVLLSALLNT